MAALTGSGFGSHITTVVGILDANLVLLRLRLRLEVGVDGFEGITLLVHELVLNLQVVLVLDLLVHSMSLVFKVAPA